MIYAYYPGCSLHSTGREYDLSLRVVCEQIGIELKELDHWICCGTSAAHQTSSLLTVSLPAKNIAEAEKLNLTELLVPCAACYSRFKTALHHLQKDPTLIKKVEGILNYRFENKVKILHPLEVFKEERIRKIIKSKIKRDLSGLNVVCYYGCLLTRPPKVMQFDVCEYPMTMDEILGEAGVRVLDWSYKTDCCGASLSLTKSEIVLRLANNILENAQAVGAAAIVVACPLCQANLDTRQDEVNRVYQRNYNLPILYFTQVLGLAFGIEAKRLGLQKHFVAADELLKNDHR